ncbi:MAG: class I SAM-dependent methyltransferase [Nanoarchaeota archaeon]|nr:class I SAM-dependent methyltransferase [Nanoarchaeota archaeon]
MNYYDSIAEGYDELYEDEQLKKWEKCKALINFNGVTLDVGCGTGFITKKIRNVIGVDSSIKMLKQCKKLRVVLASAENLPFRKESFDTVFSFTALQDVDNIRKAVIEIKRVLRKDGELLITVLDKKKISIVRSELNKKFNGLKEENIGKDVVFFKQRRIQHRRQCTS